MIVKTVSHNNWQNLSWFWTKMLPLWQNHNIGFNFLSENEWKSPKIVIIRLTPNRTDTSINGDDWKKSIHISEWNHSDIAVNLFGAKTVIFIMYLHTSTGQGCQISPGTIYQNGRKYTKLPQKIQMSIFCKPNSYIICRYTEWPWNTYTKIFHLKAFKIIRHWDFWYENVYHLATLLRARLSSDCPIDCG
jgi:hypothetical protein